MPYDFTILRELRKKRGMTIAQLAEASGVSYVVISKLERNQGNPELRTLDRISAALKLPTHNLLALAEQKRPTRAAEARRTVLETAVCRGVDLDGTGLFYLTAPAGARGARSEYPEHSEDHYEHCFVLDGRLRVTVRGEEFVLGPGEALRWDGLVDHAYEALEDSTFIVAVVPKRP